MNQIKVLVVDDSALVRKMLTDIIESDPQLTVVHAAKDPYEARDYLVEHRPDVITLDIEMPKMDGVSFLKKFMRVMPTPTIIISSLAEKGKSITIEALEAGAVGIITKNKIGLSDQLESISQDIINEIKAAAKVKLDLTKHAPTETRKPSFDKAKLEETTDKVIAIGASTGGVEHLSRVLPLFPAVSPGVVIVQHMPEGFTASFAERLNSISQLRVKEAEHGDRILPGVALLAPGGECHMRVVRKGGQYFVELEAGEKVTYNRPSVDVMFDSVAEYVGKNAVCVLMTGMGKDGAKGMLNCRNKGSSTIIQSEKSCVIFGMPGEAKAIGAAEIEVDLMDIPQIVIEKLNS
ncbi:MAG TPA: chemotaxis response regulator protein-glutamate methylesterase [Gammaproteobacteria bacterium]|nr:chemotaxis response regulator protein-glutamate methylesterase [Gammaproteobacteria bacterium]HBF09540.1 chemotaxis response regulator protein-glutamate methylesterase [Gammaproteobacteria bacterium]HCK92025.1 chemotaxis response regulator protein-glutamate methylesterase [Gammaproteobacteria bacterium]|tara:strand:- start:17 stop:1063 length:1047 start_codon:yes stop_codon:yes gene_type:complete